MKSILMSIKPKRVEKILNGEKTIIVRKTRPKVEAPFKVYLYCTKPKCFEDKWVFQKIHLSNGEIFMHPISNGKVVAEFTCDKIEQIEYDAITFPNGYSTRYNFGNIEDACLTENELYDYLGEPTIEINNPSYNKGKYNGYAWHITDLKIYDEPKEIQDFHNYKKENEYWISHTLKKAHSDWCYAWEN